MDQTSLSRNGPCHRCLKRPSRRQHDQWKRRKRKEKEAKCWANKVLMHFQASPILMCQNFGLHGRPCVPASYLIFMKPSYMCWEEEEVSFQQVSKLLFPNIPCLGRSFLSTPSCIFISLPSCVLYSPGIGTTNYTETPKGQSWHSLRSLGVSWGSSANLITVDFLPHPGASAWANAIIG